MVKNSDKFYKPVYVFPVGFWVVYDLGQIA